jgi:transposase InsO family protein
MFVEGCQHMKVDKIPSWDWFRLFWRKNKNIILPERNGKTAHEKEAGNYAKIIPALHVGDQWQMDGWDIPVYCKKRNEKGGWEYFVRYTLFVVMDTHSRKIIGFDVAESENTETILTSLDMAVRNTKTLPKELVADNHSWNKTKESANLKEVTEKLGMVWTIDSNPRRKAILERAFRTLGDKHFKRYYGYLGQGIKSKIKNGITQQELKDEYSKPENMLTFEQITA